MRLESVDGAVRFLALLPDMQQAVHAQKCQQLALGVIKVTFGLDALGLDGKYVVQDSRIEDVVHSGQVGFAALDHG